MPPKRRPPWRNWISRPGCDGPPLLPLRLFLFLLLRVPARASAVGGRGGAVLRAVAATGGRPCRGRVGCPGPVRPSACGPPEPLNSPVPATRTAPPARRRRPPRHGPGPTGARRRRGARRPRPKSRRAVTPHGRRSARPKTVRPIPVPPRCPVPCTTHSPNCPTRSRSSRVKGGAPSLAGAVFIRARMAGEGVAFRGDGS